jgi:adenosylhomocysteine nucleosidase
MSSESHGCFGILCAMPEELGSLRDHAVAAPKSPQGLELQELEVGGVRALAAVSGVGKVHAARAATLLVEHGARAGLLVVGTCGGLTRGLVPGSLVHCTRAAQVDFAVRQHRETDSDPTLRSAWLAVAPGSEGWFLTADRPVITPWRRLRLARAFAGPCAADMETAAVARVAHAAGVPWAALRAVTDGAGLATAAAFARHYPTQSGRAADTVPALLERLMKGS